MNVPFWKMHASGNDFVVIDNREGVVSGDIEDFVMRVCRPHYGVGADGLILIEKSKTADFRWHFHNADGGEVEMCGNGSRCAALFAYKNGIAGRTMSFETRAGLITADVVDEGTVKVQLTDPTDFIETLRVPLPGRTREAGFINTGVPHVVYFVDDLDAVDVIGEGSATRYHDLFAPAGTNANFAVVTGRGTMAVRTYERGVEGETMACGTGATACALVAGARGLVDSPVLIGTRGGNELKVYFTRAGAAFREVYLEGDAVLVYRGELEDGALI